MQQNQRQGFLPSWYMLPPPPFMPLPCPPLPLVDDSDIFINSSITGQPGPAGPAGPAGVSVVSAIVESNPGNLIITLSDGTVIDAGNVIGPEGPEGPEGAPGKCDCKNHNCIVITNDYQATDTDYYIGVDSKEPVTITLPENCSNCQEIVIKAQMGPPLGNRKVTILAQPGSYIDDKQSYVISVPFGFVRLICQNNNWYIIG